MFKQLKNISFVINISGLIKLISNLLILGYIKLKSHHPIWQKTTHGHVKGFPLQKSLPIFTDLIIK